MLTIELYNQIRGTRFAATEHNLELINKLNALGVTEEEVKAYRLPEGSRQHEMRQMASDYAKTRKMPKGVPDSTPEPKAEPTEPKEVKMTTPTPNNSAEALIAALNGVLKAPSLNKEEIEAIVKAVAKETVDKALKDSAVTRIEVKLPNGKIHEIKGTTHQKFKRVLEYISRGKAVYLHGPAGTGKTVLAQQIAEALGFKFYYSGQLSQEYKITGFTDANGHYQPTPFYYAWTEGGVFLLDELDRSFADVVTFLNGALANGIVDFPAPIGMKKMHPDFRCIAAGNTLGRGSDGLYTAANQLDASTLNRFLFVGVDYDKKIEDAIDKEAADFVRVMRKAAGLAGLDIVLSYRQITSLAELAPVVGTAEIIEDAITAPLSKDDIIILKNDRGIRALADKGNKYALAFAAA